MDQENAGSPSTCTPSGILNQDATWRGGRWRPSSLSKKGHSPQFSAHVFVSDIAVFVQKRGLKVKQTNPRPMFVVAKRLDGSRCHLVPW